VLETAVSVNGSRASAPAEVTPIEFEGMIATSMAMRMVFQQIMQAAVVDVPVLITRASRKPLSSPRMP
jgi:DNA-binding NtrC family response regulator